MNMIAEPEHDTLIELDSVSDGIGLIAEVARRNRRCIKAGVPTIDLKQVEGSDGIYTVNRSVDDARGICEFAEIRATVRTR
jgi:hypothetical protein